MAIIQVTPEILTSRAGEVRTIKSQHDETMSQLRTLVLALNESWKGDAQDAFVSKFESMHNTFTNFSNMLETYSKLMEIAARDLQTTDQNLRTTIQNSFN